MFKNMGGNIKDRNFHWRNSQVGDFMGGNFQGGSFPWENFPETMQNK